MTGPTPRPLVVLAHGTADERGRAVLEQVTRAAAAQLGVEPRLGYVDVCEPTATDVLTGVDAPVVVPLFLASGYHVHTDVPQAVAEASGATATPAVGSRGAVIDALVDRVHEADPDPDGVVLTGAGSSNPDARDEVATAAELLAERLGVPVRHAFLTAAPPTVAAAHAELQGRIVVAAHLLAPGYFHGLATRAAESVASPVTEPLGPHPRIVDAVVERYRSA